jgi:hypothetical protein
MLGLCDLNYYKRAIYQISSQIENAHYFLFSDDPDWTSENIKVPGPKTIVDINPPELPHEDLRLISLCRHHIIANSSFSWWGAWLGETPGQMIIAPKIWFSKLGTTAEIVPERWLKI